MMLGRVHDLGALSSRAPISYILHPLDYCSMVVIVPSWTMGVCIEIIGVSPRYGSSYVPIVCVCVIFVGGVGN